MFYPYVKFNAILVHYNTTNMFSRASSSKYMSIAFIIMFMKYLSQKLYFCVFTFNMGCVNISCTISYWCKVLKF